jgi:hypothetical protein
LRPLRLSDEREEVPAMHVCDVKVVAERREHARTPGKFKEAEDAGYRAARVCESQNQETKVTEPENEVKAGAGPEAVAAVDDSKKAPDPEADADSEVDTFAEAVAAFEEVEKHVAQFADAAAAISGTEAKRIQKMLADLKAKLGLAPKAPLQKGAAA